LLLKLCILTTAAAAAAAARVFTGQGRAGLASVGVGRGERSRIPVAVRQAVNLVSDRRITNLDIPELLRSSFVPDLEAENP